MNRQRPLIRASINIGLLLLLLLGMMISCQRTPTPPELTPPPADEAPSPHPPEEPQDKEPDSEASESALFSEADLLTAVAANILSDTELSSSERDLPELSVPDDDIDELASESPWTDDHDLTIAAVLPAVSGMLSYYRTNGSSYQIFTHDQATDQAERIYASHTPVQSVASNLAGSLVVASIRLADQYDVFVFDTLTGVTTNLTSTAHKDELDVSITADGSRIAWGSETNAGRKRITVCDYDASSHSCSLSQVTAPSDQIQGSLSSNGNYLALIRIEGARTRVRIYDFDSDSYTNVVSRIDILSHPSVTDDGQKVMYLRDRRASIGRQVVRVADLSNESIRSELSSPDISHVHMTADGNYFTYDSQASNGYQRAFTRNMLTKERASAQGGNWDYGSPYWTFPTVSGPAPGNTYSLTLINVGAVGQSSQQAAQLSGLPQQGSSVTVERGAEQ